MSGGSRGRGTGSVEVNGLDFARLAAVAAAEAEGELVVYIFTGNVSFIFVPFFRRRERRSARRAYLSLYTAAAAAATAAVARAPRVCVGVFSAQRCSIFFAPLVLLLLLLCSEINCCCGCDRQKIGSYSSVFAALVGEGAPRDDDEIKSRVL